METAIRTKSGFWDRMAHCYDKESGQGLIDRGHKKIWLDILERSFPGPGPARILDVGCGTGFLSLLLCELGHGVTGLDFSGKMLALARTKARARNSPIDFVAGQVQYPPLAPGSFDHVIGRHIMWTLPDPWGVVANLKKMLGPRGSLVLLEGYWKLRSPLARTRFYLADWIRVLEEGRKPPDWPWAKKRLDDQNLPRFSGSPSAVLAGILDEKGFTEIWKDPLEVLTAYERSKAGFHDRIRYLGLKERRFLVGGRVSPETERKMTGLTGPLETESR